jgi:hypothetical protein
MMAATLDDRPLNNWTDLERACASGFLDHHQRIELKTTIPPSRTGDLELACDLAALSQHSGLMIVGIHGVGIGATRVHGILIADVFCERIYRVARSLVYPALGLDIRMIRNPLRPEHECVIVTVPATGPHYARQLLWSRTGRGRYHRYTAAEQSSPHSPERSTREGRAPAC